MNPVDLVLYFGVDAWIFAQEVEDTSQGYRGCVTSCKAVKLSQYHAIEFQVGDMMETHMLFDR